MTNKFAMVIWLVHICQPRLCNHLQNVGATIKQNFFAKTLCKSACKTQDGNGRTGRMILFRECLYHGIAPFIIEDSNGFESDLKCTLIVTGCDGTGYAVSERTGVLLESLSVFSGRINDDTQEVNQCLFCLKYRNVYCVIKSYLLILLS